MKTATAARLMPADRRERDHDLEEKENARSHHPGAYNEKGQFDFV